MTAGHNYISENGVAEEITFTAGLNYDGTNLGVANATKYYIPESWVNNRNSDYDWALIELDQPLGEQAGYVTLMKMNSYLGTDVEVYGYPYDSRDFTGSSTSESQIVGYGTIKGVSSNKIYYDADTEEGMSGSPVVTFVGAQIICIGVHTSGFNDASHANLNSGVKINDSMISFIHASTK